MTWSWSRPRWPSNRITLEEELPNCTSHGSTSQRRTVHVALSLRAKNRDTSKRCEGCCLLGLCGTAWSDWAARVGEIARWARAHVR
jgi:hypothetical protein